MKKSKNKPKHFTKKAKIKPDHSAKILFRNPQTAADLLNGYFFRGRPVIQAENVQDADPVLHLPNTGNRNSEVDEILVDKLFRICQVKTPDGMVLFGFAGIQNQTSVDYLMPLRDLTAVTAVMNESVREIIRIREEKEHKQGLKFRKNEKVPGVVIVTIFFSPKRWTGPKDLSEITEGAEGFGKYMAKIRCNLIVPAELSNEECLRYGKDLAPIFLTLKNAGSTEEFEKVLKQYENLFTLVPKEAANVISSILKLDLNYNKEKAEEEGGVNMAESLLQWGEEKKRKGILLGEELGLKKGLQQGEEIGLKKGLQQGEERAVRRMNAERKARQKERVCRMAASGLGTDQISLIEKISVDKVNEILEYAGGSADI